MMPLVHRHWIVRVLAYAGTGILMLLLALLTAGILFFVAWGAFAGPDWLQWSIDIPLVLILLTFVGRSFHRKGF